MQQDIADPCGSNRQSAIIPSRRQRYIQYNDMCMHTTYQYTISASSPRSSVPAATVRPSIDTSQERSALCSPSYGTAGRHRSVGSQSVPEMFLPHGTQVSRTLDRRGTRAIIPYAHDTIPSRGNDHSSICAGNSVNTMQRRRAFSVSFERM